MQKLNLPEFEFKIKSEGKVMQIYDPLRKKWIVLTPEEWVRQNFVRFLTETKHYSSARLVVEKTLNINRMKKRCDALYYDVTGKPQLLIECKAPEVKITQRTFDQIARYNRVLNVPFLIVTNGMEHYCCTMDFENERYHFLREIPYASEL
jgi:hypothetical protein